MTEIANYKGYRDFPYIYDQAHTGPCSCRTVPTLFRYFRDSSAPVSDAKCTVRTEPGSEIGGPGREEGGGEQLQEKTSFNPQSMHGALYQRCGYTLRGTVKIVVKLRLLLFLRNSTVVTILAQRLEVRTKCHGVYSVKCNDHVEKSREIVFIPQKILDIGGFFILTAVLL